MESLETSGEGATEGQRKIVNRKGYSVKLYKRKNEQQSTVRGLQTLGNKDKMGKCKPPYIQDRARSDKNHWDTVTGIRLVVVRSTARCHGRRIGEL